MLCAINTNPDAFEHRDCFSRTCDNLQFRPENPPVACPAEDVNGTSYHSQRGTHESGQLIVGLRIWETDIQII